jgi:hypothetical protein
MHRILPTIGERDLERELLRKATVALRESSTRCRDCGRTPLTGERVHGGESGATVRVQVSAR